MENYQHSELTHEIIAAAWEVYNYYGNGGGFVESIFEKSLEIELKLRGFKVNCQHPIAVYYKGHLVGDFLADIIVDDIIILELKAVSMIHAKHEVQLVNYLRATPIEVGLLLNFGNEHRLGIKRKIFSNSKKINQKRLPYK